MLQKTIVHILFALAFLTLTTSASSGKTRKKKKSEHCTKAIKSCVGTAIAAGVATAGVSAYPTFVKCLSSHKKATKRKCKRAFYKAKTCGKKCKKSRKGSRCQLRCFRKLKKSTLSKPGRKTKRARKTRRGRK